MEYILGFNIGNTNTTLGIYKPEEIIPHKIFTFKTAKNTTSDQLGLQIRNILRNKMNPEITVTGMAISSVVPEVDDTYRKMSRAAFGLELFEVNCRANLGITLNYDNPAELGADRISNAVAAYKEYKTDCLIIDLGTANTFCVIRKDGIFEGGLISPGIGITISALAEKTSKLPLVKFEKPEKMIATRTLEAVKSGCYYASISMINGITDLIQDQYNNQLLIILTGGLAGIISPHMKKKHQIDPELSMKGIKYIYNMNNIV